MEKSRKKLYKYITKSKSTKMVTICIKFCKYNINCYLWFDIKKVENNTYFYNKMVLKKICVVN